MAMKERNDICPKCGGPVDLYLNDRYLLEGNFKPEHMPVAQITPEGDTILYHQVCVDY